MSVVSTEALVIRKIDFGEAKRIAVLYTPDHGKVKGVTRKPRSYSACSSYFILQPLNCVAVVYHEEEGRELFNLTQCDLVSTYSRIPEDYESLVAAMYLLELANRLTPEKEPNNSIYLLLKTALRILDKGRVCIGIFLRAFEIKLLALTGYAPQMEMCSFCNKHLTAGDMYFSIPYGGMVCKNCAKNKGGGSLFMSQEAMEFIKNCQLLDIQKFPLMSVSAGVEKELGFVLYRHIIHHTEQHIKSYRFISPGFSVDRT